MPIDPSTILRLEVPQWQGGNNPAYQVGAQVLAAIAPTAQGPVERLAVPVPTPVERPIEHGIVSRAALLDVQRAMHAAIERHQPAAIVTLGGDCLIDLAPIAYLNKLYADDLAVLWIDAHPDVMTAEQFSHGHAHVLGMLLGEGDAEFVATVPNKVRPEDILYVGLTETMPFETDFIARHGIAHLGPEALASSIEPVLDWLRASGKRHVAVHFDLDVLDPANTDFLLFNDPAATPETFAGIATGRMKMAQITAILSAVAAQAETVGLAIAEYLPWSVIRFARDLEILPLIGNRS